MRRKRFQDWILGAMMTNFTATFTRICRFLFVGLAGVMLVACADYDLEIDAPILNQVGVLSDNKPPSPLKERAPLIVPPTAQLPQPGEVAKAPTDMNWPDDPDVKAKQIAKLKQTQKEAEEKKKGPWHKAINSALGTGDYAQPSEADKTPVPSNQEQSGGLFDGLGSGNSNSSPDVNERIRESIN